ncbi:DNA-processing protein DprA [Geomicrobium sp. JCM 19038]|uniref:DNA-processing protein DprA n=1 Tax=Geomicrobium sp. JCM 19038 TaxID=1460635 RepID=UPI00045F13AB|nr:DNA-processing protein DprA [Geomicrobium sp. JCM 19038]GAK07514.1 Rossmann fold nucleotide-binding protein Smf [Geomicrobium sp. JCM 19038]
MNTKRNRLLYLHSTRKLSSKHLLSLIRHVRVEEIHTLDVASLAFLTKAKTDTVNTWTKHWKEHPYSDFKPPEIPAITLFDQEYPRRLYELPDLPPVLYYSGNLHLIHAQHLLAVIGTRSPSRYAETVMPNLLEPVIQQGAVIVSGLARGIDTYAHKLAIGKNGTTIAVIAGGLNHIYPKENRGIANLMATKHLILSEYFPTQPPEKWHFPERNRIISGLCDRLFVVEAGVRSGTQITVDCALEQGKDVYALPGNIDESTSKGTNQMIFDGAQMVLSATDLLFQE